jgi:hypothetical protein
MLETYEGILSDNHIEWSGDAPKQAPAGQRLRVHVTILDQVATPLSKAEQGKRMREILEELAAMRALASITDPAAWERETRRDRPLPGRED